MIHLCCDLFLKISELLTDREKIYLTMVCKKIDGLKHKFKYHDKIDIRYIRNLSYFDNFEYIKIYASESKYPKHVKYIYFYCGQLMSNKFLKLFSNTLTIPNLVTHLQFGVSFNEPIENLIPQTVTHLTFGYFFNQPITNIPSSVTHLKIDYYFRHWDTIPNSVVEIKSDGVHLNSIPDRLIPRVLFVRT